MKITLTIETDSAAFDPAEAEVARILRAAASIAAFWDGEHPFCHALYDLNGNKVGKMEGTQ